VNKEFYNDNQILLTNTGFRC